MASSAPALAPQTGSARAARSASRAWLAFGVVALAILQVELIFAKSINWDELLHFSQIHASLRGEPVQVFQTPHVWLFRWVPALAGTPIEHIQLIRLLILPFAALTLAAIYGTARRFASHEGALLAALAYGGAGYVFTHATALRADMIAASLLASALWILATRPLRAAWLAGAALLCILAFIATIKSVLWAPALGAMLAWRLRDQPGLELRYAIVGSFLGGVVLLCLVLAGMVGDHFAELAIASLQRMFSAGLFPQISQLHEQLVNGCIFLVMAAMGLGLTRAHRDRAVPGWLLAGLVLPVLSVAIYRNAHPYFYVFILPPLAIVAARGADRLIGLMGARVIVWAIVALAALLSLNTPRDILPRQKAVMDGMAQIAGGPVSYIDDAALRPDYPRAVPQFASGWALEGYRAAGKPRYRWAMHKAPTPLLLREGYALKALSADPADTAALLPEDAETLRDNFIPHWGQVYIAGRRFEASAQSRSFMIFAPGPYTLEGQAAQIDGKEVLPGEVVTLAKGRHTIGPVTGGSTTLRWGDHLPVPEAPYPDGELFEPY